MRAAAISDTWRHVLSGWSTGPKLKKLSVDGVEGFHDGSVTLAPGMAILCGPNASGKTRLAKGLYQNLKDGTPGVHCELSEPINAEHVMFIDLFELTSTHLSSINEDQALQDRIDQAGGLKPLRPSEVGLLNWLLGLEYSAIQMVELESTTSWDATVAEPRTEQDAPIRSSPDLFRADTVPYFVVDRDSIAYSSRTASRGELAAWTLFWALKTSGRNRLLILDEPELFLSPHASGKIFHFIAKYVDMNASPAVVASHSPQGLVSSPEESRVLFEDSPTGISISRGNDDRLWAVLKIAQPALIVFAVEDEAARTWLQLLLSSMSFQHIDVVDIWVVGGDGEVRKAAAMPHPADAIFHVYGVLDGDQKDKGGDIPGRLFYLPGDVAPETFVVQLLQQNPSLCQPTVGQADVVTGALFRSRGVDVHERLTAIAGELRIAPDALCHNVWVNWLNSDDGRRELNGFASELASVERPPKRR